MTGPNTLWMEDHLWESLCFRPEKLWEKRTLHRIDAERCSMMKVIIDAKVSEPSWSKPGVSAVSTLFSALNKVVTNHSACWIFVTDIDGGAASHVRHETPARDIGTIGVHRLRDFELYHPVQGPGQYLVLLFDDRKGCVVISRIAEIEIAFYGPDDRWAEINGALFEVKG